MAGGGTQMYRSGGYFRRRADMAYYHYLQLILACIAKDATSLIDVGTGNAPYLEDLDWIGRKVSVDIAHPYASDHVEGITGDIHTLSFPEPFSLCTCFQVLEHVPDAQRFAARLTTLAPTVLISVPFEWPTNSTPGHVHDPVTREKLRAWFGREPNWSQLVEEPFAGRSGRRLFCIYDRNEGRRFGRKLWVERRQLS